MDIFNVYLPAPTTATTFGLGFQTNIPATSYVRYGTSSGSYPYAQDISTSQVTSHAITLTGLAPNTTYYYTIRVTSSVDAINRPEDYFTTSGHGDVPRDGYTATNRDALSDSVDSAPTDDSSRHTHGPTPTPGRIACPQAKSAIPPLLAQTAVVADGRPQRRKRPLDKFRSHR